MNTSSYLKLSRHNVYIFRRRIPKALLDFFITNELRISTKTSNKKTALHIARGIANESDLIFERLKNNKNMADKKEDFTKLNKVLEDWKQTNYFKTRIEEEFNARLQEIVERKQEINKLKVTHEHVLNQQQVTYKQAIDVFASLVADGSNTPGSPPKIDFKLSELVDDFFSTESLAVRHNAVATIRKNKDSLRLFIEVIGDKLVSQVGQPDAVRFAKACPTYGRKEGQNRSVSSMNGYMSSVSKFSGWIAALHSETGHIKLDFSRLRFKRTKRAAAERAPFSDEEVLKILNHPEMSLFKRDDPPKYWLPHIAAYSGARLEEISQLNPFTDIYEENGIWFFDINEDVDKTLKNKPSIRKVPIHSELIKIGLLSYVDSLKALEAKVFFPNETVRDSRIGKNAGKRVGRFIQKEVGIQKKSLHNFRHSLATKFKQALLDEGVTAAIMGHEHGGMSYKRYGKDYLPVTLKAAVESLVFK